MRDRVTGRNAVAYPILRPASLARRSTINADGAGGVVLGVESLPDGWASGMAGPTEARDWVAGRAPDR